MKKVIPIIVVVVIMFTCHSAFTDDTIIETFASNLIECRCGQSGYTSQVVIIGQAAGDSEWAYDLNWTLNSNGLREKIYRYTLTVPGLHVSPHNGSGAGYNRRGKILQIFCSYDEDEDKCYYKEKTSDVTINVPCSSHSAE
jgi:hypothetical protein